MRSMRRKFTRALPDRLTGSLLSAAQSSPRRCPPGFPAEDRSQATRYAFPREIRRRGRPSAPAGHPDGVPRRGQEPRRVERRTDCRHTSSPPAGIAPVTTPILPGDRDTSRNRRGWRSCRGDLPTASSSPCDRASSPEDFFLRAMSSPRRTRSSPRHRRSRTPHWRNDQFERSLPRLVQDTLAGRRPGLFTVEDGDDAG